MESFGPGGLQCGISTNAGLFGGPFSGKFIHDLENIPRSGLLRLDEIGFNLIEMRAEWSPDTSKSSNDFIDDEQNVVLLQYILNGPPVTIRRRDDATGSDAIFRPLAPPEGN